MKNPIFITPDEISAILDTLHIQKGSYVCVQASDRFCKHIIGEEQAILNVLMDRIGTEGCLFMPTFSFSTLDPSCLATNVEYEDWKKIREWQLGYHPILTSCDQNGALANQFLKNENVTRTTHPVYSFAFSGNTKEKEIDQRSNFPLSFTHALSSFADQQAINLLFDKGPEESVLLPAIAKTLNKGVTSLQRAVIKKGKNNAVKTFLVTEIDGMEEELLGYCYKKETRLGKFPIYRISLDEIQETEAVMD